MEKEIKSKEEVTLKKDQGPVQIKTSIDYLKTYNEKILKENIYLTTKEDTPYDFYIKTENGLNKGFIEITEDGPKEYTVKQNEILGHLIEIKKQTKRSAKRSTRK